MNEAEGPAPERYRQAAQRLRGLAEGGPVHEIQADLLSLAARFDRMAADLEGQRRSGATSDEV